MHPNNISNRLRFNNSRHTDWQFPMQLYFGRPYWADFSWPMESGVLQMKEGARITLGPLAQDSGEFSLPLGSYLQLTHILGCFGDCVSISGPPPKEENTKLL
jgi:hypothetical protein